MALDHPATESTDVASSCPVDPVNGLESASASEVVELERGVAEAWATNIALNVLVLYDAGADVGGSTRTIVAYHRAVVPLPRTH